jgi:predicted aspartyl protease
LSLQSEGIEEGFLDGSYIVISGELNDVSKILTHALVDCGATGYAFADEEFVRDHNLPLYKLSQPRSLEVIDGRPVESGVITHLTKLPMNINGHKEEIPMFITQLGHYPIVLGLPWLRRHDVNVSFARNSLVFDSDFCLTHCCPKNAVSIQGISIDPPEKVSIDPPDKPLTPVSVAMIAGSTFTRTLRRSRGTLMAFKATVYELDRALRAYDKPLTTAVPQSEDDKIRELVPADYHVYLPLFKKAVAEILPPHRSYDHCHNRSTSLA